MSVRLKLSLAAAAALVGAAALAATVAAGAVRAGGEAAKMPPGWTIVTGPRLSNPNGQQSFSRVACPAGTVALSGGAIGFAPGLGQNLNSSDPVLSGDVATGWDVAINNASGADSSYQVYAICAAEPKNYAVVQSESYTSYNGEVNGGFAACPVNKKGVETKALGGGVYADSGSLAQTITDSFPEQPVEWHADVANASGADSYFQVFVICGNEPGYSWNEGYPGVTNPPGAQTQASVGCPAKSVQSGGGGQDASLDTRVAMHATLPSNGGWLVAENNASGSAGTLIPYSICIK